MLLRAAELCDQRWDTIVFDEAQDLQEEAWLLVQELAKGKRFWAFHDPGQTFWEDRHPPKRPIAIRKHRPRA